MDLRNNYVVASLVALTIAVALLLTFAVIHHGLETARQPPVVKSD